MKKYLLLPLLIIPILHTHSQTLPQKLDSLLTACHDVLGFNGSALVAQKGTILLAKGYGYKNKQTQTKNDAHTIFQIGSITKQFTSAIILQLQEQHKLSVEDHLSKYLPGFPNGDKITIDQLLTHTAGVYNYTNDRVFMQTRTVHPIDRDSLIALFKDKPLDFQPGEKFSYSNSGYILLGRVIEKVTNQSYFQVVREQIFRPLHMDHTGFDFTHLQSPDKATGYAPPNTDIPASIVDSSVSFAAGAIYSSVEDLYKWDRALHTDMIIHQASLEKAYTPRLSHYGYGWIIDSADGKRVISHSGGITGFVSNIYRIPADETCIVLLQNTPPRADLGALARKLHDILDGKDVPLPRPKVVIAVDTTILRQYVGQYELAPNFILTVTLENGHLMTQATGQGKVEIFAEKENLFFLKVVEAELEFIKGPDGKVEKLILHQNGDHPAKRIQ